MNKITLVEVEHFYNTGKKYYLKEISHKEGKEYLESKGISPSTAADSIYIYRNFVTAHGSTRTTSALVIEYFLNRIHIELGDIGLRNATTSLSKHIKHYTEVKKINIISKKEILNKYLNILHQKSTFISLPDELIDSKSLTEGKSISVLVNKFERNQEARKRCLAYYGCNCSVCKFNFGLTYGTLGADFIHVHHIIELSAIRYEYVVDPIEDLRPVCPNCHAMLHKKTPAYTIDELIAIISLASAK